jgi:aminoglycoside phosphotransferase (APT) family kinase protein
MIGERHGTPFVLTYMADPKRLVRGPGEMLELSDMAHYLLSLGLVKPRDVVEEDLAIVDASRRNCVFLATTRAGPTFVVKQAGPRSTRTLAHEAAVLAALADATELADRVPAVVHYEPAARRLVVSTPGGARDWGDHRGRFPRIPARVLGRTLAALHRLPAEAVEELPEGVDRMWALSLPEPPHELVLDLSAGAQDLVARVQASDYLCRRLDELRGMGDDAVPVHGDLRWANCLTLAAPASQRRTRVVLVDWELAGPGAAAFDVGTVLAEYLSAWIGSIPIVEPGDPGRLVARARHPLERMRPAIHDFWSAYRLVNPLGPALRRVIELAAVRLLQTAVEHAQGLAVPTAHVMTLLQLADNMLRHPEDAALTLLALRE